MATSRMYDPNNLIPGPENSKYWSVSLLRLILPKSHFFKANLPNEEQFQTLLADKSAPTISCRHLHDDSCLVEIPRKVEDISRRVSKIYFLIHLVPFLLFKRGKKGWGKGIFKLLVGILRSVGFAAMFSFIGKIIWCYAKNYFAEGFSRRIALKLDFICPMLGILVEHPSRWGELCMNISPRLIESIKLDMKKNHRWIEIKFLEHFMLAFSVGAISYIHNRYPETMKRSFKFFFDIVIGSDLKKLEKKEFKEDEEEKQQNK